MCLGQRPLDFPSSLLHGREFPGTEEGMGVLRALVTIRAQGLNWISVSKDIPIKLRSEYCCPTNQSQGQCRVLDGPTIRLNNGLSRDKSLHPCHRPAQLPTTQSRDTWTLAVGGHKKDLRLGRQKVMADRSPISSFVLGVETGH